MQKTVIEPVENRPFSRAIVVEEPSHKRVFVSGAAAIDESARVVGKGDIAEQTRVTPDAIRGYLDEAGGGIEDIVRVRGYANCELTAENYAAINEARREFFTGPNRLPSSSVVGVKSLVLEDLLIEIDAEAIIPDDGWSVTVSD
ncbi:MAG: RidA family protein [Halobacteriales archaeon]|nr:RidA family protein [Halobacteriales archaeon]